MDCTDELYERLEKLAYRRSEAFCYPCYKPAPVGRCAQCGSDDLARLLPQVGVDWGCDWIIRHILSEELEAANTGEAFEDSIRSCYAGTTAVAWLQLDTVDILKTMDPLSWDLAQSEWIDSEESEGNLVSFDNGGAYYWRHDLENFLDESEADDLTEEALP